MTKTNSSLVVTLLAPGLYEVSGFNSPGYSTELGWVCPPCPLVMRVALDAGPAPIGLDVPTLLAMCIDVVGESHPATGALVAALASFGPAEEGAPLVPEAPAPKKPRKKKEVPVPVVPAPAPAAIVTTDEEDEDEPEETQEDEDTDDDVLDSTDTDGKEGAE